MSLNHQNHSNSLNYHNRSGFTIIEILIVIAVIATVSLVTAPLGLQFYNSQTLVGIQGQLGDTLTRARSQSVVQKNDSAYGVCLNNSGSSTLSYTLYQGASGSACSTHNTINDENYLLLSGTAMTFPASATEINFAKHTGTPTATGTISIVWNGLTKTITVDSLGTIIEN
jgi:prepilin-type N-terminal cleavage/methylation domain-containing protein